MVSRECHNFQIKSLFRFTWKDGLLLAVAINLDCALQRLNHNHTLMILVNDWFKMMPVVIMIV